MFGARALSILALLTLSTATGCFYDSSWGAGKRAQINNAARAKPASLAPPPPETSAPAPAGDDKARALHVRVHAAPAYAAQTPDWKSHVAGLLAQASATLEGSIGVRLVLETADPWEHVAGAHLEADLAALREEDAGEGADLVLGLIGGLPLTTQSFDQLGMSELPGKHLVVRAPNVAAEYAAIEKAFNELSADARARLRQERIRHREVAVLLHEVGHALGAPHESIEGSLMRPAYDAKMAGFDADSIAHMKETLARAAGPARADGDAPDSGLATSEPPKKEEDAPSELRAEDRDVWRRASDLAKTGDSQGAWVAARPLFASYPLVYGVQDLRCKLAMATLGSYPDVRRECEALMALSMKGASGASGASGARAK